MAEVPDAGPDAARVGFPGAREAPVCWRFFYAPASDRRSHGGFFVSVGPRDGRFRNRDAAVVEARPVRAALSRAAFLVALSRVYVGIRFLGDIVGGALPCRVLRPCLYKRDTKVDRLLVGLL
jgi:hypothetical protein